MKTYVHSACAFDYHKVSDFPQDKIWFSSGFELASLKKRTSGKELHWAKREMFSKLSYSCIVYYILRSAVKKEAGFPMCSHYLGWCQ